MAIVTLRPAYLAFALSLIPPQPYPCQDITIFRRKSIRKNNLHLPMVVTALELSQPQPVKPIALIDQQEALQADGTAPPQPDRFLPLLVHIENSEPILLTPDNEKAYRFDIPDHHPLLQILPLNPFKTPLYTPHPLSLSETHTLLTHSLHPLQLPAHILSAWPHPFSLTFTPNWPSHLQPNPLTHSYHLRITHPVKIRTPHPHRSASGTLSSACLLTDPAFSAQPHTASYLFLERMAQSFLFQILLEQLPPHWYFVEYGFLDTAIHDDKLLIHPISPPYTNTSLLHGDVGSSSTLLYLHSAASYSPATLFNTPVPSSTFDTLNIPIYFPSNLFDMSEYPPAPKSYLYYIHHALSCLQSHNLQSVSC